MTLKEQLTAELENLNPKTLADLQELKFKYRNLCNYGYVEKLAVKLGYIKSSVSKTVKRELIGQ